MLWQDATLSLEAWVQVLLLQLRNMGNIVHLGSVCLIKVQGVDSRVVASNSLSHPSNVCSYFPVGFAVPTLCMYYARHG